MSMPRRPYRRKASRLLSISRLWDWPCERLLFVSSALQLGEAGNGLFFLALPWTWTLDDQNQEPSSLRSWGLRELSPLPWQAQFSLARPWQARFSLARPWQARFSLARP